MSSDLSSVEHRALRWALHLPSSVQYCVDRSALPRALRPPPSIPACIECSVLCQSFRPAKSAPSCVKCFVPGQSIRPPSTDPDSKSVESPVPCIRVSLRLSNSGQIRTSAGQRRTARTNRVLRPAFRDLCPATTYRSVSAIAGRDIPEPSSSDRLKPQEKIQRKLQGFGKGKTSKRQEIATY